MKNLRLYWLLGVSSLLIGAYGCDSGDCCPDKNGPCSEESCPLPHDEHAPAAPAALEKDA